MRSIYIALLIIGFLSLSQSQRVAQTPLNITIVSAVSCNDTNNVTGCSSCVGDGATPQVFTCATATDGYFVNSTTKQAQACPRACTKCSENVEKTVECSECQMNAWFNAPVGSVGCQTCKAGYTLDNGLTTNTNLTGICISVAADGQYSCQTGFWWNSLPNPSSACVANLTGNCLEGYANATGNTSGITSNCVQCASGYSQLISQAQNGSATDKYYWTQMCSQVIAKPARTVVNCQNTTATTSCSVCAGANNCTTPAEGFYTVNATRLRSLTSTLGAEVAGMVYACPLSCKACTSGTACTSCDNAVSTLDPDTKYCKCNSPYTSSIPYDTVKNNTANNYACIQFNQSQSCDSPYLWNTQLLPPTGQSVPQCIGTSSSYSCYADTRTIIKDSVYTLSNFWNMPPNPMRMCITPYNATCPQGYTPSANGSEAPAIGQLRANCANCTSNYNLVSSNDNQTQVCQAQNSSIITMSLFLLGLLLSIMF